MKRYLIAIVALCSTTVQSAIGSDEMVARSQAQGILMNRDVLSIAEMGTFAQNSFTYGTARSMAMAGAMTSLGGDATSMLINPAGLGMYRSNEFTLTPVLTIQRSETKGGSPYTDNDRAPFAIGNMSAVINLYESAHSPIVSINFGVGYNRIADLNYGYSFASTGNSSSIANLFSRQLTSAGVSLSELYGNSNPNWNDVPTNLWGAVLGYKSGLTFQQYGEQPYDEYNDYNPNDTITDASSPIWNSTWIGRDASIDQYMVVESEGHIGEYDISMGANILNKFYLGLTVGVQSLNQRLDLMYGEEYYNSSTDSGNELIFSNYNQTIITDGIGINVKLGVIARPVEALRIGLAYHSPTYYSLNRQYQGSMGACASLAGESGLTYLSTDSPVLEDINNNSWSYRTNSKLMVGASYIFNNRALLSVDYERDWYGSMKMQKTPVGLSIDDYNNDISGVYQSVDVLRIGGEVKVAPSFALRGGYGFSSSMVRENSTNVALLDISTTNSISYFSAGIGYALSKRTSIDLTYMCQTNNLSDYTLFYGQGDISTSDGVYDSEIPSAQSAQSGTFSTVLTQHKVALSMVFKL